MAKTRSTGTSKKTVRIDSKKKLTPLTAPKKIEVTQSGLGILSKSKTLAIQLLKITGILNVPDVSTMGILEHRPPRQIRLRNASPFAPSINHKIRAFAR